MTRWLLRTLTELSSRRSVSRLAGLAANSRLSRRLIPAFVALYRIDTAEAELPPEQYPTLNAFFTRRLKPGARPVDPDPAALVSPVDGRLVAAGPVADGTVIEVKGQSYSLSELLNGSPRVPIYAGGHYWVLYLSPSDYHRIHAPCDGEIAEQERIPGRAYPVNEFGLGLGRRVLSRNERLVTYIRHEKGEVAVVKVGAMNVSSIRCEEPLPSRLTKGEEFARFEFGSTVVLLAEGGLCEPRGDLKPGDRIRVGERLATIIGTSDFSVT
ncbi:MAG: phosphatidylserine decarboxylase [Paenibacillaceae bacterium ZCTH02-B3]|nr:MAG: phosphatidylserine decarboxylase [Paenibacillaceae bacterium ZCTH02-B3]